MNPDDTKPPENLSSLFESPSSPFDSAGTGTGESSLFEFMGPSPTPRFSNSPFGYKRKPGRPFRTKPPRSDLPHANGISTVGHKHEAILQFMVANPDAPMGEIAQFFGISPSWLSCVVYSDAFQVKLKERQNEVFSETILPLKDKIQGVAHRAIDRLGDAIETVEDPNFLLNASDKLLHRLGYAPSRAPQPGLQTNTQNNVNFYGNVDNETIQRARSVIHKTREERQTLEYKPDESESESDVLPAD